MTRNQIIEEIFADKQYLLYCKQMFISGDLYKDLFQYVITYLLEMPEKKIIDLYDTGGLRMYIARIIYINAKSKSSQFYKQYRSDTLELADYRHIQEELSENDFENWLNKFDSEINNEKKRCINKGVYPAQIKLYELYEEKKNYTKVAQCTRIPYKTVQRNIKSLRKKIIEKIND